MVLSKNEKTLLLGGLCFLVSLALATLNKETAANTLANFLDKAILYMHYCIGAIFVLGFFQKENLALHITTLLLSALLVLLNLSIYLTRLV